MIEQAMLLVYTWHKDQIDKAGRPIIMHLLWVAGRGNNEVDMTVALLHDIVEDTPVTLDILRQMFPKDVVEAIDCLTRREGEDYINDYLDRVDGNHLARQVKIRDLIHHMRLEGSNDISMSLRGRYRRAYHRLTGQHWEKVEHLPD